MKLGSGNGDGTYTMILMKVSSMDRRLAWLDPVLFQKWISRKSSTVVQPQHSLLAELCALRFFFLFYGHKLFKEGDGAPRFLHLV